jgi:TruD family tRNA pseudouridine synthase
MSEKRIRHAGLKDKKAITCQRISIERVTIEDVSRVKIKDIILKNFRYTDERLSIGDLKGNRFTIKIRNCRLNGKELKDTVKETISQIKKKGIYNLYGEQRFSRANVKIADEILKGNYENAIKILLTEQGDKESEESKNARQKIKEHWKNWNECIKVLPKRFWIESAILNHLVKNENDYIGAFRKIRKATRKIIINAYQSYIFNRMLEEFKDEFEELPLIGYGSEIKNERIKNFLEKEKFNPESLRIKSMPEMSCIGGTRKTKMFVQKLRLKKIAENEFTITFELPKGSYATLVTEEFIKNEKTN